MPHIAILYHINLLFRNMCKQYLYKDDTISACRCAPLLAKRRSMIYRKMTREVLPGTVVEFDAVADGDPCI